MPRRRRVKKPSDNDRACEDSSVCDNGSIREVTNFNATELYDPKAIAPVAARKITPMDTLLSNIKEIKSNYIRLSTEKKLEKLGLYSLCQDQSCECKGWTPLDSYVFDAINVHFRASCKICEHSLSTHICHFQKRSKKTINNLLSVIVDLKFIEAAIQESDEDEFTLEIYRILCKIFKKSIELLTKPEIEGIFGVPPFHTNSISMAMKTLVLMKFSDLPSNEFLVKLKCGKLLLHYFEAYKFLDLRDFLKSYPSTYASIYKLDYSRWLCFCELSKYFNSIPHFRFVDAFSPTVFLYNFEDKINEKIEQEKLHPKIKIHLLSVFEEYCTELKNPLSPVYFEDDPPLKDHIEPFKMVPKPIQLLFPALCGDISSSREKQVPIKPERFLDCKLTGRSDLPDGVPKEMVTAAMGVLKNPCQNNDPCNTSDNSPHHNKPVETEKLESFEVHIVANSVSRKISEQCKIYLVGLQRLFSRLLPEIPKICIARFIFDTKHKCLALISGDVVIGGVCFRMFPDQDFSEIVFCGIKEENQFRGYGTQMMNHLKDYHIERNIHHFLTYADDTAIEYFEKQGFTSEITLKKEMYACYIKEYVCASLMQCKLDPKIRYVDLKNVLQVQKEIVQQLIDKKRLTTLSLQLIANTIVEKDKVAKKKIAKNKVPKKKVTRSKVAKNKVAKNKVAKNKVAVNKKTGNSCS